MKYTPRVVSADGETMDGKRPGLVTPDHSNGHFFRKTGQPSTVSHLNRGSEDEMCWSMHFASAENLGARNNHVAESSSQVNLCYWHHLLIALGLGLQ